MYHGLLLMCNLGRIGLDQLEEVGRQSSWKVYVTWWWIFVSLMLLTSGSGMATISIFFSVQSLRTVVANMDLWMYDSEFIWMLGVSLKVNCFVWRMFKNKIPLWVNLVKRGVLVASTRCSFYDKEEKKQRILFFFLACCDIAKLIWRWMVSWSPLLPMIPDSLFYIRMILNAPFPNKKQVYLRCLFVYTTIWLIWKTRKAEIFKKVRTTSLKTTGDTQFITFN